jgi:hypothetical protein
MALELRPIDLSATPIFRPTPASKSAAEEPRDTVVASNDERILKLAARCNLKLTREMVVAMKLDCSDVAGMQAKIAAQYARQLPDDMAALVDDRKARCPAEASYHAFLGGLVDMTQNPESLDKLGFHVNTLRSTLGAHEFGQGVGPRFYGLVSESLLADPASPAINRVCLEAARKMCQQKKGTSEQFDEGLGHLATREALHALPLTQAARDRVDTAVLSAMRQINPVALGSLTQLVVEAGDTKKNPQPPLTREDRQALEDYALDQLRTRGTASWHQPWLSFLDAVETIDFPIQEGSTYFRKAVLDGIATLRDPSHGSLRWPVKEFLASCPSDYHKTLFSALGKLQTEPDPLAPAKLALALREDCRNPEQAKQFMALAVEELGRLKSPQLQVLVQGIQSERLREGLEALVKLEKDPIFQAALTSGGSGGGVRDEGSALRIGQTYLRKRSS